MTLPTLQIARYLSRFISVNRQVHGVICGQGNFKEEQ